jgi:hypothetical protein
MEGGQSPPSNLRRARPLASVFDWFSTERRERRRSVRLDRKYLEARSRRFLRIYLKADETRKPRFYRVIDDASKRCQSSESGLPPSELDDAQIAEATSRAAMRIVLQRTESKKDDRLDDFVTRAKQFLLTGHAENGRTFDLEASARWSAGRLQSTANA